MIVQLFIHGGHIDVNVGMLLLDAGHALGRGDQVDQADIAAAAVLDELDGRAGAGGTGGSIADGICGPG